MGRPDYLDQRVQVVTSDKSDLKVKVVSLVQLVKVVLPVQLETLVLQVCQVFLDSEETRDKMERQDLGAMLDWQDLPGR